MSLSSRQHFKVFNWHLIFLLLVLLTKLVSQLHHSLVNWLRKQSQDEAVGIRYTVLFHKLLGEDLHHKFPNGRPSKNHVSLDKANMNMQVVLLTQPINGVGATDTARADTERSNYLESLQFSGLAPEET
jgi:hypothetical protein